MFEHYMLIYILNVCELGSRCHQHRLSPKDFFSERLQMLSQREVFKKTRLIFLKMESWKWGKPVLHGALLRGKKLKMERFIIWLSSVWCLKTVECCHPDFWLTLSVISQTYFSYHYAMYVYVFRFEDSTVSPTIGI
jgi:hypothetical protein